MAMECLKAAVRWRIAWFYAALAVPLGVLIGVGYVAPLINGPPVTVIVSAPIDEPVYPGGLLRFKIQSKARDRQNCTGYISREFAKEIMVDGKLTWDKLRLPMVPPPMGEAGVEEYVVSVPIPLELTVGKWRYRASTVFDCGVFGGGIRYYVTTPVFFTLAPKG